MVDQNLVLLWEGAGRELCLCTWWWEGGGGVYVFSSLEWCGFDDEKRVGHLLGTYRKKVYGRSFQDAQMPNRCAAVDGDNVLVYTFFPLFPHQFSTSNLRLPPYIILHFSA
jgi:hypothetical protein